MKETEEESPEEVISLLRGTTCRVPLPEEPELETRTRIGLLMQCSFHCLTSRMLKAPTWEVSRHQTLCGHGIVILEAIGSPQAATRHLFTCREHPGSKPCFLLGLPNIPGSTFF